MQIRLSLLITYYNEGEMLTECVASLLAGTTLPDEILIYDDCSPRPAADFVTPHPNLRIIRGGTNRGASYARDFLLREARGGYAHYHDTDDLFAPEWCEEVVRAIEENPEVDLVINNWRMHHEYTGTASDGKNTKERLAQFDDDIIPHFIMNGANTTSTTFKKKLAIQMGGYQTGDLRTGLDWYFNIRLALCVKTYVLIDKQLVIVRLKPDSISRDAKGRPRLAIQAKDKLNAYSSLLHELPEKYHPFVARKALSRVSSLLFNGFKNESREIYDFAYGISGNKLFEDYPLVIRVLIRVFGFWQIIRLVSVIRNLMPTKMRRFLRETLLG